jgi:preprotein translocase subunit SecG
MSFIVGILTFLLVLNSLLLVLLVLMQLPKKDAGGGLAFGGGTGDALFGAGSGNALTKITKWGIVVFVVMIVTLGWLQDRALHGNGSSNFMKQLQQQQQATPSSAAIPPPAASTTPGSAPGSSVLSTIPAVVTNTVAGTNSAK